MNILLLGYGKMGKTIEEIAVSRGHQVIGRIDNQMESKEAFNKDNTDVAIEFSQPDAAVENISWCLRMGIPVLSGTTGWLGQRNEVVDLCREESGTFFYASNYSLGVNIFFKLNEFLAKVMQRFPSYDIQMEEIHHTEKKDSPSGTAITIAETIIENIGRKEKWVEGVANFQAELGIRSLREPNVPGTHTVIYSNDEDSIELKHIAHSRRGFALGAVLVAEWLPGKKGVLGMDEFLDL
ncbi:4-hydroxy-tetrahydrodipicolinate reductase [Fulvivirga sedimenti]|uniref:4-hydroxy-tetrahydrodipicolinate reductase n=1 Tax=Fulvivirga sedimenti TaxID=2879465 RepID=A0A9X1HK47_9BACT|nr:4-hydroxy-tetrahydrodipicolinate reductase [Fulvivirga sedimenti]MCA6073603.1 4-hydroxy-tetrahydrodipicolinate reductase [Fulvivirga sedimenti]